MRIFGMGRPGMENRRMTHEGDPPYIVNCEKWGYEREPEDEPDDAMSASESATRLLKKIMKAGKTENGRFA